MSERQVKRRKYLARIHYTNAMRIWLDSKPPFYRIFKRLKWRKEKPEKRVIYAIYNLRR